MDIESQKLEELQLDNMQFEGFKNVLAKPRDEMYLAFIESFGKENCISNGHAPRTKHEVLSGISKVEKRNIQIDVDIVNLPYTVLNARKKPAKTAFTTMNPEQRKIFLVPDHTPTRILSDKAFHIEGFDMLLAQKEITKSQYDLFVNKMDMLNVGERVSASIIHEYGHILTYKAFDELGISNKSAKVYEWLNETGYLDNCSKRIVGFADFEAPYKINVALEQLAEDYRVSYDIYKGVPLSPLPHSITFVQDAKNHEYFLEGVEGMTKVLLLDKKNKKGLVKEEKSPLEFIIPFGEADRTDLSTRYTDGQLTPLTAERKARDLKVLADFDNLFGG
jgi:hypothetical protein